MKQRGQEVQEGRKEGSRETSISEEKSRKTRRDEKKEDDKIK